MVFSTNPLALSVPDSTFESWLRDSGYLEVLDRRSSSSSAVSNTTSSDHPTATLFSNLLTLFSLFTLNPISKLTSDDFSGPTPSWTGAFFGDCGSYSFPSAPDQAKRRVHENVKRYARNYASLFILFLACSLYQMPLALIGLVSSLAIWDSFKYFSDRWGWDRYPFIWQILVRTAQCATAVILIYSNVQMAIFCAMAVSYVVMILHAAFRKLTPAKQPSQQR